MKREIEIRDKMKYELEIRNWIKDMKKQVKLKDSMKDIKLEVDKGANKK